MVRDDGCAVLGCAKCPAPTYVSGVRLKWVVLVMMLVVMSVVMLAVMLALVLMLLVLVPVVSLDLGGGDDDGRGVLS